MAHNKHYYISKGKKKEFSFYEKWAGKMRILSEKKLVDIVDSEIGLSYLHARPAYIAWRTGTTTLCLSWLYPPVGNFEFGCWKHQSRDDRCKPNIFRICLFSDINSYWHTYKQIIGTNMVVSFIKLHRFLYDFQTLFSVCFCVSSFKASTLNIPLGIFLMWGLWRGRF